MLKQRYDDDDHCFQAKSASGTLKIEHHAPNIPIILVGTKLDLREDKATVQGLRQKKMEPVSYGDSLGNEKRYQSSEVHRMLGLDSEELEECFRRKRSGSYATKSSMHY